MPSSAPHVVMSAASSGLNCVRSFEACSTVVLPLLASSTLPGSVLPGSFGPALDDVVGGFVWLLAIGVSVDDLLPDVNHQMPPPMSASTSTTPTIAKTRPLPPPPDSSNTSGPWLQLGDGWLIESKSPPTQGGGAACCWCC
jgi:hypothetical protein